MTRIIQGDLCLEKAYKAIFDEMCEQRFTGNDNTFDETPISNL